jgi:hypothetical protein
MRDNRYLRKAKACFWLLLVGIYSVAAADVVIDVLDGSQYRALPKVAVTSVHSPVEARKVSATQIAAMYRASSGTPFASLPPGTTFKVVWPDGSSEYVQVLNATSSSGTRLLSADAAELADQGAIAR